MFATLDVSASALTAQRIRMDTIAGNVANAFTTQRADGQPGPYQRRVAVFSSGDGSGGAGVHVAKIAEDAAPPRMAYEPGHPLADARGYVAYPNVDMSTEMIDMIEASRAYEANVTAMNATKAMFTNALRLLA